MQRKRTENVKRKNMIDTKYREERSNLSFTRVFPRNKSGQTDENYFLKKKTSLRIKK